MEKLVCESLEDFKRGVDPRTGLDIGAESTYFWPKSYEELADEQKKEAFQNWFNSEENEPDHNFLADDDYLLEPLHAEMVAFFGEEKYTEIAPLIENSDFQKVYYDLDRKGSVNIVGSVQISDDHAFLQWLGIPLEMQDKVHYNIDKYTIEFEENDYDYEFSIEEREILAKAQEKWEEHLESIRKRLNNQRDYARSEEFFKEEVTSNEWEFDKNLNVVA